MPKANRIHRNGANARTIEQAQNPDNTQPAEVKVVRLRECATESEPIDTPAAMEDFWRRQIQTAPNFDGERESLWVFLLNTRKRVMSFQQLSQGTKDTLLVNCSEVFRLATVQNAAGIIIAHNHPSGDPSPSEADIKVTRDLLKAAEALKIELVDHVIIGDARREKSRASLRALGFFYADSAKENSEAAVQEPKGKMMNLVEELNQIVMRADVLQKVTDDHLEKILSLAKLLNINQHQVDEFNFGLSLLAQDVRDQLKKVSKAMRILRRVRDAQAPSN